LDPITAPSGLPEWQGSSFDIIADIESNHSDSTFMQSLETAVFQGSLLFVLAMRVSEKHISRAEKICHQISLDPLAHNKCEMVVLPGMMYR